MSHTAATGKVGEQSPARDRKVDGELGEERRHGGVAINHERRGEQDPDGPALLDEEPVVIAHLESRHVEHLEIEAQVPGKPQTDSARGHDGGAAVTERPAEDPEDAAAHIGHLLRAGPCRA